MSAGFTPGPWERRAQSNTLAQVGGPVIADLNGVGGHDANLITAAPDLYVALNELIETLRREAPGTPLNNHRFDTLGIKANRALAKARGEQA